MLAVIITRSLGAASVDSITVPRLVHVGDLNGSRSSDSGSILPTVGGLDRDLHRCYRCSRLPQSQSQGDSRSAATPLTMEKSSASITAAQGSQVIDLPSGSSAVKVATAAVPFSAYFSGASPSRSGISSTSVTLMVTVMVELRPK